MDTLTFLRKILPSRGYYFVATLQPGKERPWFRHFSCDTREEAAARATALDSACENVYYACSSYREPFILETDPKTGEEKKRVRVQDNVLMVRSFWIDLDVKNEPNAYPSQQEAISGLAAFLKASLLPVPLIVSSGNGLHCYWPLTEDILPPQWLVAARLLKSLATKLGLKQDPSRTSDHASVLRPVGTYNRKDPQAPKLVELVRDAEPIGYLDFYSRLVAACRSEGVDTPATPKSQSVPDINQQYLAPTDYPDSHASLIADRCPQIRAMRDTGGNIPEPVWYGAIQVLRCTVEGRDIIHAWSSGYAGYSPDETDKKIAQVESMGPLTCDKFEERNPAGCVGCPYKGKISSPILLGIQRKPLAAPVVTIDTEEGEVPLQAPNPPAPFLRTQDGIFVEIEAGAQQKILGHDFYLSEIIDDEHMATHQVTAHVKKPQDPPESFFLPLDITGSMKELEKFLRSKSVFPDNAKLMGAYVTAYLKNIQQQLKTKKLVQSMGWKDDYRQFVLGRKVFSHDGSSSENTVSSKIKSSVQGIRSAGSLETWVERSAALARPGLEQHAFSLLLGFGAPLLTFAGHNGVIFSMLGQSGGGKSTMGNWLMSIWGRPDELRVGEGDTQLAQLERLGAFCNLPMYMDESSKVTPERMSDLAYQITRGEGRRRLKQDGTERAPANWSTFLVTSTNSSWQSAFESTKRDSQAEQVRVFEYDMPVHDELSAFWRETNDMFRDHYGHAGEVYARHIVKHAGEFRAQIRRLEDTLTQLGECAGNERFWVSGAACALLGGLMAQQLGLIRFDVAPVMKWVVRQFKLQRQKIADSRPDEMALLGAYLDEFADNRLVIGKYDPAVRSQIQVLKEPRGGLLHRYEMDAGIMWIDRKHIRSELIKRRQDPDRFRDSLLERGILSNPQIKITLGKATQFAGAQTWCWQLNMKHPAFMDFQEKVNAADQ